MSLSIDRSALARLQGEIADLRKKEAAEAKKEATANMNANRAAQDASKVGSESALRMKLREVERHQKEAADCAARRADCAHKISRKLDESNRVQERISRAEKTEQKKEADRIGKLTRDLESQRRTMQVGLARYVSNTNPREGVLSALVEYDVFISHASEDKDSFVRAFAEALQRREIKVWYDEHSLRWGDSLRREIDKGLANSRFGVVVLSKHFFAKEWPQTELDGLMAKELNGESRILPIWHNISKDEVLSASPILGNKLALSTATHTLDEIADRLKEFCGD